MQGNMIVIAQEWPEYTRYIITEKNGRGAAILEIYNEERNGMEAFIYSLMVDDQVRGYGIGRRLLYKAEHLARGAGMDRVYLTWSGRGSEDWVFDWYLRRGYEEKEFGKYESLLCKTL